MDRKDLAIKGSVIGLLSQGINLIAKFAVKTFFIRYLGHEFLGLDGVLADTISTLSLADLGISSSMIFRLYKPIIKKDYKRINELMASYKKIYYSIAMFIFFVGVFLSLFLTKIIKGVKIPTEQIYIAFYLQLACSVSSYILSYKRIVLNADQKKHLCILSDLVTSIVFCFIKILIIVFLHSYPAYLFSTIFQTITSNILLLLYTKEKYPYIDVHEKSNKNDIKTVFRDAKDLLGNRFAGYIYSSTDNIIISTFLGTNIVGLLSNYKYISSALRNILNSTLSSIQPLIGNYLNSDIDEENSYLTLKRYTFIRFILAGITTIPFLCLINCFILVWTANNKYVLDISIPILIAADHYISCVYGPLGEYIIGMGMFKKSKYPAYAAAFTNLFFSLLGVNLWGINGVLLATVLSQLIIWAGDIVIVFKSFYKNRPDFLLDYLWLHFKYIVLLIIDCMFVLFALSTTLLNNLVLKIIFGGFFAVIVFGVSVLIIYKNSDEFNYLYMLIKRLILKIVHNKN